MVFGILAGIGAAIAGVGIFRGSSKVGNAAEAMADHTGRALDSIAKDVNLLTTHFVKELGPRVTNLLDRLEVLTIQAEQFIITGTFAIKILALTLLMFAVLICKYVESEIERGYARSAVFQRRRFLAFKPEKIIVCFLKYMFFFMAVVLVLDLVKGISQITWPMDFPIIIIIPSIATVGVFLQHIVGIFKAIWKLTKQVLYCVFGLPVKLFIDPFQSGTRYCSNPSILLSIAVAIVAIIIYSLALVFLLEAKEYIIKRRRGLFHKVVFSYAFFCIIALTVSLIWSLFVCAFVRPIWAFQAKRNYHKK